jgi:hypothetical protein
MVADGIWKLNDVVEYIKQGEWIQP